MRWAVARLSGRVPRLARGQHVSVEVLPTGVALVKMDVKGEKQNTFNREFVNDIVKMIEQVEADDAVKAVVVASGKKGSWIAGANIQQIEDMESEAEAASGSAEGQQYFDRIAAMQKKKPWIAAIDGACLGGGMEFSMTMSHRIASTSSKTVMGVPEVMLGLLPGWGGTQRLPQIVGAPTALDLMLAGKMVKPARAKKMGLVDLVVDEHALERTAIATAEQMIDGGMKPKTRKLGWMDWFLEKTPVGRHLMFKQATEKVMKQTKGKYPAPLAILECARPASSRPTAGSGRWSPPSSGSSRARGESTAAARPFAGQTDCKKNKYGKPAMRVETLAVLGAGLMGAGIAQCSASKGFRVLLKDQHQAGLSKGEQYIASNLGKKFKKKRLSRFDHDYTLANVVGLTDDLAEWRRHFASADLVIEAVFEELSVKHKVVAQMEEVLPRRPSSPPTPRRCRSATSPSTPSGRKTSSACTTSRPPR